MGAPAGRLAHHRDGSATGPEQAQNELEQGGFTAAIGTDHGHEIPFADRPIDVFKDPLPVVGKIEVGHLDDRCRPVGIT